MTRASLTPTYGLGSGSRIGPAILISSPRNNIASQGRIYAFEKARGQGQQYISFLLQSLGPQRTPYANGKYGPSSQLNSVTRISLQIPPPGGLVVEGINPLPGGLVLGNSPKPPGGLLLGSSLPKFTGDK